MAPRTKKGAAKSATSSKAKATKKRALPQEESVTTETSTAAPEKPAKRLRSSTVVVADVEANFSTALPTAKPVSEAAELRTKDDAPTASTATASASTTPPAVAANKTQIFTGSFDLYSMDVEALNAAYAPPYNAAGAFDESFYPEALYKAIIASERKTEINEDGEEVEEGGPAAKLTFPIPGVDTTGDWGLEDDEDDVPYGTLTLSNLHHPYCGDPIEIAITEITEQPQEALDSEIETPDLGRPTEDAWDGPGITATLEIQDDHLMSMIPAASGKLCIRPVWKGVGEDDKVMELFEGSLTFRCIFSRVWAKRAGKGADEHLVFWAVRGKA